METQGEKLILVGYMDNLKAYKLMNPISHKVSFSRSAIIHEGAILQQLSPAPLDKLSAYDDPSSTEDVLNMLSSQSGGEEDSTTPATPTPHQTPNQNISQVSQADADNNLEPNTEQQPLNADGGLELSGSP